MLKLYDYFRSSASFRVRIALNLKGLDYEIIPIHLVNQGGEQYTDAYKKINPQCLVPALEVSQQKIITQSLAIIEYLEAIQPEPSFFPSDPFEKALARSFALSIAAEIHPLNNLRVLKFLIKEFNLSEEQKLAWYQHWITLGLSALEAQLTSYHFSGDFCFGKQPGIADICLVPQIYNARRFNCDLSAYPHLVRIDQHCQQHDAFAKAWPEEIVT